MIAQRLAVVAGEDNHRVVALPRRFERLENACKLIIDLRDHCVVTRLASPRVVFLRRSHLVLKIALRQQRLRREIALTKVRPRHICRIKLFRI